MIQDDAHPGVGMGTGVRRRPRRVWVVVLALKVAVMVVLLSAPAGLAVWLGAAHLAGMLLMFAGMAIAVVVLRRRGRGWQSRVWGSRVWGSRVWQGRAWHGLLPHRGHRHDDPTGDR